MIRSALLALAFAFGCGLSAAQPLTILTENDPPSQFIGSDGELTGYTVELVRSIQRLVGNRDAIRIVPWARGYQAALNEPQVVLFLMARTAERKDLFQWVGPVLELEYGLYGKASSGLKIGTLDEAKKVRSIGVYRDDVRDQVLTHAGFTNLDRTNDNVSNVRKLMAGRVDLYASSSLTYGTEASEAGFTPKDLRLVLPFQKTQLYIAVSKGTDQKVVDDWNGALKQLRRNGSWQKVLKKYYPQSKLPGPPMAVF